MSDWLSKRWHGLTYEQRVRDFLWLPYVRHVCPDDVQGFGITIEEFPGCTSQGDCLSEAWDNIARAAVSWCEAAWEMGQEVPQPAVMKQFDEYCRSQPFDT